MRTHVSHSNVPRIYDPLLSRYPVAHLSEPGYWYSDDDEATGLRAYLVKGGFLIVDDFSFRKWEMFARAMRCVMPDAQFVRLERDHPLFNPFFRTRTLDSTHHPSNRRTRAEYYDVHASNDRGRRLLVVVNDNNDIGDCMEWSGQEWYAANLTNDAQTFATNDLRYALTH